MCSKDGPYLFPPIPRRNGTCRVVLGTVGAYMLPISITGYSALNPKSLNPQVDLDLTLVIIQHD